MIPSKEKFEEIVKELQKIMRIQDWDIDVKLLTAKQMNEETGDHENLGEVMRNMRHKYALIRINAQDEDNDKEWYHTLVHELKHIQTTEFIYVFHKIFSNLEMPDNVRKVYKEQIEDLYEQWMNVCAREFVSLYPESRFFES